MKENLYLFARKALRFCRETPRQGETFQEPVREDPEELDNIVGRGALSLYEEVRGKYGVKVFWRIEYRREHGGERLFFWSLALARVASPCAWGASFHTDGLIGHVLVCDGREADTMRRRLFSRSADKVEMSLRDLERCLRLLETRDGSALRATRAIGGIEELLEVAALEEL